MLGANTPHLRKMSDAKLLKELNVLSPLSTVALMRLSLLVRIITRFSGQVMLVISHAYSAARSWLATVQDDLSKLATVSGGSFDKCRDFTLHQWMSLILNSPKMFLKSLEKTLFLEVVNVANFWFEDLVQVQPKEQGGFSACPHCGFVCATSQGLAWHLFDVHDLKDPIRDLIDTTVCSCCMQEYHSRERLVRHISVTSPRCCLFYFRSFVPLARDVVEKLDTDALEHTLLNGACDDANLGKKNTP